MGGGRLGPDMWPTQDDREATTSQLIADTLVTVIRGGAVYRGLGSAEQPASAQVQRAQRRSKVFRLEARIRDLEHELAATDRMLGTGANERAALLGLIERLEQQMVANERAVAELWDLLTDEQKDRAITDDIGVAARGTR